MSVTQSSHSLSIIAKIYYLFHWEIVSFDKTRFLVFLCLHLCPKGKFLLDNLLFWYLKVVENNINVYCYNVVYINYRTVVVLYILNVLLETEHKTEQ